LNSPLGTAISELLMVKGVAGTTPELSPRFEWKGRPFAFALEMLKLFNGTL